MAQTPLYEQWHTGGFLVSMANGHRSIDRGTLTGAAKLYAGTVVGKKTLAGTATSTPGTNTGNGVMGAITVGGSAKPGNYTLKITKAATNAGDFEVIDPTGEVMGLGSVAAAFNTGGLAFTLADGATDFVVGDTFTIAVAAGSGSYIQYEPTATDGSQVVAGILYATTDATAADQKAAFVVRSAEVNASELIWDAALSAPQIATATAQLAAIGIIAR